MPLITFRRETFHVSDYVAADWAMLRSQSSVPRNRHGLPIRPMPAGIYNGDAVPEGIFVDWQHDDTRVWAFNMRNAAVAEQPFCAELARQYGFQHTLHPYRAYDAWQRRIRVATARGGAPRDPSARDPRRWSARPYTPQALAATASSRFRCFGIEIEFAADGHASRSAVQAGIGTALRSAGIAFHARWSEWHRAANIPGWHGTYDSTVAGEVISDILDGSQASLDETSAVLRACREAGATASRGQGMHVHHDVRDFTLDDKVRLVDNLAACQDALLAYVGNRTASGWCRAMTASEFAATRRTVAAGSSPYNDHGVAWNFGHLFGARGKHTVEFRALGHTLNGRKVRAWVRVGQALMTATKAGHTFRPDTSVPTMLAILRQHGLSRWAADVFARRTGTDIADAA